MSRVRPLPPPSALPAVLDPESLPRHAGRRQLAEIHQKYFGPLSHRTLETWPLRWRIVNGQSVADVREFLAEAQRRFDSAPVVMGGRRKPAEQHAA